MSRKSTVLALGLTCVVACGRGSSSGLLLITSGGTDQVFVLDAETGYIRDSVAVDPRPGEGDEPHGIAVSPAGDFWYVTVSHGDPTLWKFTWPENRRVGLLRLGLFGASRIGLSPDGETGYVPDYYRDNPEITGSIAVVRLHDMQVTAAPAVCVAPHDAQVSRRGDLVAVACSGSDEVVFMETRANRITNRVSFPALNDGRTRPMNIVWMPGDSSVVVSLHGTGELAHYRIHDGHTDRLTVGMGPAQLALTADGTTLVSANRGDGTASIVSLTPFTERARVNLGVEHPHGVTIGSDDDVAFITYEGTTDTLGGVLSLHLPSESIRWDVPLGTFTLGVTHVTPP